MAGKMVLILPRLEYIFILLYDMMTAARKKSSVGATCVCECSLVRVRMKPYASVAHDEMQVMNDRPVYIFCV